MLSKSTQYALRALVYVDLCSFQNKRPGVKVIAQEIEAPVAYTAKVLQTLTKHNLLDSLKGRGGVFFFSNESENLSLYSIIEVVEGNGIFSKCVFGLKHCNCKTPCPLHDKYKAVRNGFRDLVEKETIRSLSRKVASGSAKLNELGE